MFKSDLKQKYNLTAAQILSFKNDGFIKLSNVLSKELLDHYSDQITKVVQDEYKFTNVSMEERSTYDKAFNQITNLWLMDDEVKQLSLSKRLGQIAADLLGTVGVRMWHDQALFKEGGGGITPWHVDQHYWPMATEKSVTAWIPLQAVNNEMGALSFGKESHWRKIARNVEISEKSDNIIDSEVKKNKIEEVQLNYDLGDVSFHYGWTLHRAGPNNSGKTRKVHTIIYMDKNMRLAKPKNKNQQIDWDAFTPSTKIGNIMDDLLNPVIV